jgi:CHASE2 domain-containing sensor protein
MAKKLVVLKVTDGSFDHGFSVTMQLGEDNARHRVETVGRLPAAPEIPLYYERWRSLYRTLGATLRVKAKKVPQVNLGDRREECRNAAKILRARLNTWHQSEDYRPIRDKWLQHLSTDDEIRVILQTDDSQLRQLPWNLLDVIESNQGYPKAEIALSALKWEAPQPPPRSPQPVRVLAILGDSSGIDTERDRALLAQLPQAKVTVLPEPTRQQLTDHLWNYEWDILFFAGHSQSEQNQESGRIFLNPDDSLSLSELKYTLRKTVELGLRVAMFNSCDGLGLARELADLQIPQVVVMREPVPDLVAQEFLKYFLDGFSHGKPFYLAFREARERLEGLEDQFPCATWLPIICQNPAQIPPTWHELTSTPEPTAAGVPMPWWRGLAIATLASLAATSFVGGARWLGLMQPLELSAYDQLLQLRPAEPPDPRLFIITIDDEDINQQTPAALNGASISDQNLTQLLTLLNRYQPKVIGLDLYREEKTAATYPALSQQLKTNDRLITICKVGYDKADPYGFAPPPEVPSDSYRVAFSDFTFDQDWVRRHLLAMRPDSQIQSKCQANFAFSTEIALRYLRSGLDQDPIQVDPDWNLALRLNQPANPLIAQVRHGYRKTGIFPQQPGQAYTVRFPTLPNRFGGYPELGTGFSQVMLNYRAMPNLADIAPNKPLRWFLSATPPDSQTLTELIQNKIVLIGVIAKKKDDYFKTPYTTTVETRTAGVYIHAHMISQLLSVALDDRPLIWAWSPLQEILWIGGWAMVGSGVVWGISLRRGMSQRWRLHLMVGLIGAIALLGGGCWAVFVLWAGWLPLVPAGVALLLSSAIAARWFVFQPPAQHSMATTVQPFSTHLL